jgi:hypothetical protein
MPDFHMKYRITHPTEEKDITGVATREAAIYQIVQEAAAGGDTVFVLQADEIVPAPPGDVTMPAEGS